MKNFFNILLTITIIITSAITISILSISTLLTEKSNKAIINNIDYNNLITQFKETNYGQSLYAYVNKYDINEKKLDDILKDKEAKKYSSKILQTFINNYLNEEEINIGPDTKQLIESVNNKYNLNLNDTNKNELTNYINNTIVENITKVSERKNEISAETNILTAIINTCQNKDLHLALYAIIITLLIILFINTKKSKNFLDYLGIIFLVIGISTLTFNSLISFINNNIKFNINYLAPILNYINNTFYIIGFIGIIGSITIFLIQNFIIKKLINKEPVPF